MRGGKPVSCVRKYFIVYDPSEDMSRELRTHRELLKGILDAQN